MTGAEGREGRGLLENIEILRFMSGENKSYFLKLKVGQFTFFRLKSSTLNAV